MEKMGEKEENNSGNGDHYVVTTRPPNSDDCNAPPRANKLLFLPKTNNITIDDQPRLRLKADH